MVKKNIDLSVVLHDNSDYKDWLVELKERFYSHRLKASCATNSYLLDFYWKLGRDIEAKQYTNNYGSGFYKKLSQDLKNEMPGIKGFSPTNLKYMSYFYKLYAPLFINRQQPADDFKGRLSETNIPQATEPSQKSLQTTEDFKILFSIPWDHHCRILSKCKDDINKALFFVRKAWENNWGRDALLNWLDTDLYERDGKAITNFKSTLPSIQSDLAQQITKDPYQFDFLNLREKFDERDIENELVNNVTRFLLELGKGFSYMGRQFRLEVGQQEFFPDLLFYNAHLHAYVVIELKAQSFHPSFLGQLSFYVTAINHQFKTDIDNPTIGLLICKDKDNVVAKYALETYKEPLGISEYQLSKLFPKDFKSSMPTIEELEKGLKDN
ncbi:PDDEXK nuclease domain-containing protein [uncultured Prevotella sp.]|uniref:PDDEXK nuclease domain-containing protein n=1 Tax=uncultured Prevotella sp. TaxID=159272 RepID=UPI0026161AFF|nr:PDDEXK nuclease domain-containing protein [uncultured Prevotella sp.]